MCGCGHPPGAPCEAGAQRTQEADPAGALGHPSLAAPAPAAAAAPPSPPAAHADGRSARHGAGAEGGDTDCRGGATGTKCRRLGDRCEAPCFLRRATHSDHLLFTPTPPSPPHTPPHFGSGSSSHSTLPPRPCPSLPPEGARSNADPVTLGLRKDPAAGPHAAALQAHLPPTQGHPAHPSTPFCSHLHASARMCTPPSPLPCWNLPWLLSSGSPSEEVAPPPGACTAPWRPPGRPESLGSPPPAGPPGSAGPAAPPRLPRGQGDSFRAGVSRTSLSVPGAPQPSLCPAGRLLSPTCSSAPSPAYGPLRKPQGPPL